MHIGKCLKTLQNGMSHIENPNLSNSPTFQVPFQYQIIVLNILNRLNIIVCYIDKCFHNKCRNSNDSFSFDINSFHEFRSIMEKLQAFSPCSKRESGINLYNIYFINLHRIKLCVECYTNDGISVHLLSSALRLC